MKNNVVFREKKIETQNRNMVVDCMKGALIILVVLGHTYNPMYSIVNYFHVGTFFILSGYCFNQKYTDSFPDLIILLIKRIRGLWIPYVAYNLIFLLLQNVFIKIGLLTDSPEYFLRNPIHSGGFVESLTFLSGIKVFIKSLFFIHARPFCGGLWFVGCLFYSTFVYAILQFLLKKLKIEKLHLVISFVFLSFSWIIITKGLVEKYPVLKFICLIFITEILFTIGTYFRDFSLIEVIAEKKSFTLILGLLYALVVEFYLYKSGTILVALLKIENPIFYLITIITGGGMILFFFLLLQKMRIHLFLHFFNYVGKKTLPVLALHVFCFKMVSFLQWKIYEEDKIVLALYPVWKTTVLWSLAYCIVGVGIPLLLSCFLSKLRLFRIAFKF